MIIRSIRLKNIKSYGKGPNDDGVTVTLEPGINRIAGRNGHGKTTLIESIGFALFLTKPVFAENFRIDTYLLRAGEKAGEIDITFEQDGELYRLERGIGIQSRRRSKVVLVKDGSIEAEDDQAVEAYLCRLLGITEPQRLRELFSKLIGVKQGRLTVPFDSTKSAACAHFEPLLDVEIFRHCFDALRPVERRFDELRQEHEKQLAAIEERLRERADSTEQVALRQKEVAALTTEFQGAVALRADAEKRRQELQAREKQVNELRVAAGLALRERDLLFQKQEAAERRLAEAREAAAVLEETAVGHEAFRAAEASLNALQARRNERDRLTRELAEIRNRLTAFTGKAVAAKSQEETFRDQHQKKAAQLAQVSLQVTQLRERLASERPGLEQESARMTQLQSDREFLRNWVKTLAPVTAKARASAAAIEESGRALRDWKSATLDQAKAAEEQARRQAAQFASQLSAATESAGMLAAQLKQISGGVCPFLKQTCQQFDPAHVQNDITAKEQIIRDLQTALKTAEGVHRERRQQLEELSAAEARLGQVRKELQRRIPELVEIHNALEPAAVREALGRIGGFVNGDGSRTFPEPLPVLSADRFLGSETIWEQGSIDQIPGAYPGYVQSATAWFEEAGSILSARIQEFESKRSRFLQMERDLENAQKSATDCSAEVTALARNAEAKLQEHKEHQAKAAAEQNAVEGITEKLRGYDSLDDEIAAGQKRKEEARPGHERYLAAKPAADQLAPRKKESEEIAQALQSAETRLTEANTACATASQAFDPAALEAARKAVEEIAARTAQLETQVRNAQAELARQEQRLREFEAASKEKSAVEHELGRLAAAIKLTGKARSLLKEAAPAVAQHICQHIAGVAQGIFNQINHDPAELAWDANAYSLRIHPGERRFAMLSGGEQTKLALAMTLAMIQEFSNLRFCIFDEPTYGVDSESRHRLADAIIEVQKATSFDQLLLVSHDDSFEGKIEHVVLLKKGAAGTEVVAGLQ